jgi:CelD/BcsL family acetyltransferase involved in cellulose biosynthesis
MERTEMVPSAPMAHAGTLTLPAARGVGSSVSLRVVTDLAEAEQLRMPWSELLARSVRNELTVSPAWLLTWWRVYGSRQGRQFRLGVFQDAGRLIGLAPLLRRRHWYRGGIPFRRLEFLASGEPPEHGIYSNHLTVLAEYGSEEMVTNRLVAAIVRGEFGSWDEVVLPMMSGDSPFPALLADAFRSRGLQAELTETARAPYIALPATWDDYLGSLSAHGRKKIRQSLKAFDTWASGTTRVERVSKPSDLGKGKEILIQLHQARWASDNQTGVFRSPLYLQFHDAIMLQLLERGSLELLWLSAHGEPVAALYGMEWAGKVYAYQLGRRTDLPDHLRPGTVLFALAIRRAIEAGHQEFDLLADEAPYKLHLARQSRPLLQLRVARRSIAEGMRRVALFCRSGWRALRRVARRRQVDFSTKR